MAASLGEVDKGVRSLNTYVLAAVNVSARLKTSGCIVQGFCINSIYNC